MSKTDPHIVWQIRWYYNRFKGKTSYSQLAKRFGVSKSTVYRIINYKTHKKKSEGAKSWRRNRKRFSWTQI